MYAMSGNETAEFVAGYVEAMAWANFWREDGDDSSIGVELPQEILEELEQDCRDFLDEHTERLIRGAVRRSREGYGSRQYAEYGYAMAGHDFALTRNGHGAGFWDRGLGFVGEALTSLAKPYGERTLMVALDGSVTL
jgi:hypothetical protein